MESWVNFDGNEGHANVQHLKEPGFEPASVSTSKFFSPWIFYLLAKGEWQLMVYRIDKENFYTAILMNNADPLLWCIYFYTW